MKTAIQQPEEFRKYLDSWLETNQKYRPLSDQLAGLGQWGKLVQVFAAMTFLNSCVEQFLNHDEPTDWLRPLFSIHIDPPLSSLPELGERWMHSSDTEREDIENLAQTMFKALTSPYERLFYNLEETSGIGDVEAQKRALASLEVSVKFSAMLAWTPERERARHFSNDPIEIQACVDSGPVCELVDCILAALRALEMRPSEMKDILVNNLRRLITQNQVN